MEVTKDLKVADFVINGTTYVVPRSQHQQWRDILHWDFDEPLTLAAGQISITLRLTERNLGFRYRRLVETLTLNSGDVLSRLEGQVFRQRRGKVFITLGFASQTTTSDIVPNRSSSSPADTESRQPAAEEPTVVQSTSTHTAVGGPGISEPPNSEGLQPTTRELIDICPRFRILVVGKSGVGKSTLIDRVFGLGVARTAEDRPGHTAIEKEFISPENDRFVLHYGGGFEAAEGSNYDVVKTFIEQRKRMPDVKDQLHAVWLCFQVPIVADGERLLEDGVEALLKEGKELLGNTPTVVVFTKYDRLVSYVRKQKATDPAADAKRYLQVHCVDGLQDIAGDMDNAHVAVSSRPKFEQSLKELISLTQERVHRSFTSPENRLSPVPLAVAGAQRMLPTLKVDFSIDVGKQRYWKVLGYNPNFRGYTVQDCLRVIHTDIVSVWNFYDPNHYLYSKQFQNLMMNMVGEVDASAKSTQSNTLDGGGVPLIALAPIVLPLNAFAALGRWAYETYQRQRSLHVKFMAYIVDLTHVLEILFSLTAGMWVKKLTRTAVKLAYKAYYESRWMTQNHVDVRYFQCSVTGHDAVLEKIISMISSDDREARVSQTLERMPSVDLEEDEEWEGQETPVECA